MGKVDLPGLSSFLDRHGRRRWRYRARGRTVSLTGKPGDPGFLAAYQAAVSGLAPPPGGVGQERTKVGSMSHLIVTFYEGRRFLELRPSTKSTYRGVLDRFRAKYGDLPAAGLEPRHLAQIMERMSATPAAANNLMKMLRAVFRHAVRLGLVKADPTRDVERFKVLSEGFPPWTMEDCAAFEATHAPGTPQRLAYALLRHTGQRRSDVVCMGWQHIRGDWLSIVQQKTGQRVDMPLPPPLADELALHARRALTFLATEAGGARSAKAFGGWFKEACKAAGLTDKSAHGLRKLKAIELAEAGLTPHQIAAITGHQSLKEVERYARAYNRAKAAGEAHEALYRVITPEGKENIYRANRRSG